MFNPLSSIPKHYLCIPNPEPQIQNPELQVLNLKPSPQPLNSKT